MGESSGRFEVFGERLAGIEYCPVPLWAAAIAFALWAGSALAQGVVVRAGEHESFTRLVVNLPDRIAYTLSRSEGGADLVFDRKGLTFDTGPVFDRIPRTRLSALAVRPGGDGLRLDLVCDCQIESFWHTRAALVIDVADAPETSALGGDPAPVTLDPLPVPPPRATLAAGLVARRMAIGTADRRPAPATDVAAPDRLGPSRDELFRQVGRAASQGLLSPRVSVPAPSPPVAQTVADTPPRSEPPAPPRPPAPNLHLRAESSIDRDLRAAMAAALGPGTESCLDERRVDVTAWGGDGPFGQQIAPLRARLVGEFDIPDRQAVLSLARLYIHFGFGAEARQTLTQFLEPDARDTVLLAMARIVDEGDAGAGSALSGQLSCGPMAALWSALAEPVLPADRPIEPNAILRGFAALPEHLRARLGPDLARRFHTAGLTRQSADIRRMLGRGDVGDTPEAQLVAAEIALSEGSTEAAETMLGALVARDSGPAAEALVRLIEARLRRGADISAETAELAGAYAAEYRGQPLGAALVEAHLLALAASGDFDGAFAALPRALADDAGAQTRLRARLVEVLTRQADDFDFLHHVLALSGATVAGLGDDAGNAVAERLMSLGFAAAASPFVAAEAAGEAGRERVLLRARIALREGRPRQAEAALLGLSGDDADLLRGEARSMAGDHAVAAEMFAAAGREDAARREAWLGGNWEWLAGEDATAEAAIARRRLAAPAPEADTAGAALAHHRDLIEDSATTRAAIAALLAAHPAPEI